MLCCYTDTFKVSINGTYYPVTYIKVDFTQDKIPLCILRVSGSTILGVGLNINTLLPLYKALVLESVVLYPQIQILYRDSKTLFFKGIVICMRPCIQGGGSSSLFILCTCLGDAGKLLYNPLTDFIYSTAGSNSPGNMLGAGAGLKPGYKLLWNKAQADFQKCIAPTINRGMCVHLIFQAFQNTLSQIKTKVLVADKDKMQLMPAISDYIKSVYKPKAIVNAQLRGLVTYIQNIFNAFKQGVQQGLSLFLCIVASLANDTMLHMIPSGDGSYMHILPTYQYTMLKPAAIIRASDLLSLTPSVDAKARVTLPGTLYVNFCRASLYMNPKALAKGSLGVTGNFGTYTGKQINTYKTIQGPWWVVTTIADLRNKNAEDALKNKTEKRDVDYKAIYNAYARYAYAELYGKSSYAWLSLTPLQKNLDIKNYIGKPMYIDLSDMNLNNASKLLWKSILGFYGVLSSVSILIQPSADSSRSSVFSVNCVILRFTAKKSPLASVFTEQNSSKTNILYLKTQENKTENKNLNQNLDLDLE